MKKSLRESATRLKKLGLINYDLRERLHYKQREKIEKLAEKYSEVLKHPQQFITRPIGKKTAAQLKQSGYETIKDIRTGKIRSLIPIRPDVTRVRIKGGIVKVQYDGYTEKWLIGTKPQDYEAELTRLESVQKRDPYNFQITGKIGSNGPFKHSRFVDVNSMRNYLKAWKVHAPLNVKGKKARDDYKNDLLQHLTIVQIDMDFRAAKTNGKKVKKNRRN